MDKKQEKKLEEGFKDTFVEWIREKSPDVPEEKIRDVAGRYFSFVKGIAKLEYETALKIIDEIKGMPLTMMLREMDKYDDGNPEG